MTYSQLLTCGQSLTYGYLTLLLIIFSLGEEFLFCPQVLRGGEPVNIEHAVQMVDLMLHDACRPILEPHADFLAVPILGPDAYRLVPTYFAQPAWDRQTAFHPVDQAPRAPGDLGIDQDKKLPAAFDFVSRSPHWS